MKTVPMFLFTGLFILVCTVQAELPNHEQIMRNDAIGLATALNIPTDSNSQIWTTSFFSVEGIIQTNDFRIVAPGGKTGTLVKFTVYSNDLVMASGRLYERSSFDEARTALAVELISNNRHPLELTKLYKVRPNNVGDFSVVWTTKNDENEITDDLSWIYFVRGAKAIRLQGKDGASVQSIAEMLDTLLMKQPK